MITKGYASFTREYDEYSRLIREAYYDTNGELKLLPAGYAAFSRTYDARDLLAEITYLDAMGNPTRRTEGYASVCYEYSSQGDVIREYYLDENRKQIACIFGFDEIRREYDNRRQLVSEEYYLRGELVRETDNGVSSASDKINWVLTQYADRSGNQAMCYSLMDPENGDLILVDGGWTANADRVRSIINAYGGKVKAWFLTHYHEDHAGAFNALWEEYRDRIEKVYVTPLDWDEFSAAAQDWDTPETFEIFLRITEGDEKIVRLNRGDELDIGVFHVKNFNAFDDQVRAAGDIPNNCSLMLKFSVEGSSVLFCGDIHGGYLSNYIMEQYGDELKASIVEPGHHGNNTMSYEFYELVNPKIMTIDAPEWLMTGENYTAKEMKTWCEEHGIRVYDYTTAPNIITAADLMQ